MKGFKSTVIIMSLLITFQSFGQDDKKQFKRFESIDANSNKEITMEEMVDFHKGKTDKKGRPVKAELLFLGLDFNENGTIIFEEFKQPINWKAANKKLNSKKAKKQNTLKKQWSNSSKEEKQAIKFAKIDADSNNEITMEEMLEFYEDKTNKKGKPVKAELLFLGLDSDNNNKLSLKEFVEPVDWKAASKKMKVEIE